MPMPQQGGAKPPQPAPQGPAGAPMQQPSANDGAKQMGMVQVETAMQMLEQALPQLGSSSPEGASVLKAMTALSKHFARSQSKDLVPAQIAEMARSQQQSPLAQMIGSGAAPQGAAPAAAPMPA